MRVYEITLITVSSLISLMVILAQMVASEAGFCSVGFFSDKKGSCWRQLNCTQIEKELEYIGPMHGGYVKKMNHVKWKHVDLVHSVPKYTPFKADFKSGLELLEKLQGSNFVLELVGVCYSPLQVVTKYYKHGSADNFPALLQTTGLESFELVKLRLQIAINYLEILAFLHGNEEGPRVMCDSNDLLKTLSQYLITDDFKLVLADLDALPQINQTTGVKIRCGHRQLFGTFVAPEQLWPHENLEFDGSLMPGYDEKTDIWKVPDIVFFFLGDSTEVEILKFRLFNILKQCKSRDPNKRPSAKEVLRSLKSEAKKVTLNGSHLTDEF